MKLSSGQTLQIPLILNSLNLSEALSSFLKTLILAFSDQRHHWGIREYYSTASLSVAEPSPPIDTHH